MATLTPLVSFNGPDAAVPYGGLIADAGGDLFGTTSAELDGLGTVFEIINGGSGACAAERNRKPA